MPKPIKIFNNLSNPRAAFGGPGIKMITQIETELKNKSDFMVYLIRKLIKLI